MQAKYLLLFRAVLGETLLLHFLYSPVSPEHGKSLAALFACYAAFSFGCHALEKRGRLPPVAGLWTFLADIAATSAILYLTEGLAGDFYIAYFLVILGSCFLEQLSYSFIVGGVACVVYGALAFPGWEAVLNPFYLLRVSLLLVMSFFSAAVAEQARRIEHDTADRFVRRLAWMERLSLVGKAVAGILHETKTPLSTILLNAERARELIGRGKDAREALAMIESEAERACAILNDFLEFSRPAELELSPIDLRSVLERALETMRLTFESRGVRVDAAWSELPALRGSERHLIQVFTNILLNACDAMPLGGRLQVRSRLVDGRIEAEFSDDGVGIPRERLGQVFEPFSTSKSESGGHGLGMSIARWIVQKHGGDIQVESAGPGRGTVVRVFLPVLPKS